VVVDGASFKDGILTVSLSRELPEEQRVKKITIKGDTPTLPLKKQIDKDWKRPHEQWDEPIIKRTKIKEDLR
jgi:hypothetical protein